MAGKRSKCWLPAFSPFPTIFSILPKSHFNLLFTFILSPANAFDLDQSSILSFSIELIVNSLTNDKIVDWLQFKIFADKCGSNDKISLWWSSKHYRKRRKDWLTLFSIFL